MSGAARSAGTVRRPDAMSGRERILAAIRGTNATLWMQPAETIVAAVAADLAQCPDTRRIFLTSAGVLTPLASLEKARAVVEGLKALPFRG